MNLIIHNIIIKITNFMRSVISLSKGNFMKHPNSNGNSLQAVPIKFTKKSLNKFDQQEYKLTAIAWQAINNPISTSDVRLTFNGGVL